MARPTTRKQTAPAAAASSAPPPAGKRTRSTSPTEPAAPVGAIAEAPTAAPEGLTAPATAGAEATPKGKLGTLVTMLRRPEGVTVEQMMDATGWQAHSVRGAIAGSVKKKLGFEVTSQKSEGGRIYRIVKGAGA